MTLAIALNYGSQQEIARAAAAAAAKGEVTPERRLNSTPPDLPPLDLLIRTSGEVRLSNFLCGRRPMPKCGSPMCCGPILRPTIWPMPLAPLASGSVVLAAVETPEPGAGVAPKERGSQGAHAVGHRDGGGGGFGPVAGWFAWMVFVLLVATGVCGSGTSFRERLRRAGGPAVADRGRGLCGCAAEMLITLRALYNHPIVIVMLFWAVIATDVGAYFAGRALADQKSLPRSVPVKRGADCLAEFWVLHWFSTFCWVVTRLALFRIYGVFAGWRPHRHDRPDRRFFESWMKRRRGQGSAISFRAMAVCSTGLTVCSRCCSLPVLSAQ
jgi:hypothetical protein